MSLSRCLLIAGCLLLVGLARADEVAVVKATLDRFHHAAAGADSVAYFDAMTSDAVFLGTDASERWQGGEFRDFVTAHFSEGRGWTYTPTQRYITVSTDGHTAWFDELLQNDGLGVCRGSGVLVKSGSGWKISQYNLSVPIPNDIVKQVATDIAALAPTSEPALIAAPEAAATPTVTESSAARAAANPSANSDYECSRKRFKTNTKAGCKR